MFLLGLALRHRLIAGLGLGGILHMGLDSIVGKIAWAWPVSSHSAPLVVVPATHDWWVLSFLTHWTFLFEIGICLIAFALFWRGRKRGGL